MNETRKLLKGKVVGVIGSTDPNLPYQSYMGILTGMIIQKLIGIDNTLLVGGVTGVGIDVFAGYSTLRENGNFVCLIPNTVLVPEEEEAIYNVRVQPKLISVPYHLPRGYGRIGLATNCLYKEIRAGEGMQERREILSSVCDAIVMLGGGHGTMDEATLATDKFHIPVIAVKETGGAVSDLIKMKTGRKDFTNKFSYYFGLNEPDLVYVAKSVDDIETILTDLLK